MDAKMLYKIKLGGAANLSVFGQPVKPGDNPVPIRQGWNWIGYLPQTQLQMQLALSTIYPEANDYIKNQTLSSMFYAGSGWFGGLNQLKSGEGYMLKSGHAATLIYPNN